LGTEERPRRGRAGCGSALLWASSSSSSAFRQCGSYLDQGQCFYEATMPKIAERLERLNANIKALISELRRHRQSDQAGAALPPESPPAEADRGGQ
jgi:hypothetical protein